MVSTLATLKYFSLFCINFNFVYSYFRIVSPKEIASIGSTFYPYGYKQSKQHRQSYMLSNQFLCQYSVIAPTTIQNLASFETNTILKGLKNLTVGNEHDPFYESVKEYLEDLEESLEQCGEGRISNVMNLVSVNPVSVYRMIYRFRNYIQPWTLSAKMTQETSSPLGEKVTDYLRSIYQTSDGPNRQDHHVAMMAITMIQHQIGLTTGDIADGIFGGRKTGAYLKAAHCLDIGVHAIATRNYAIGEEWLQLAVSKMEKGDGTVHFASAVTALNKLKTIYDKTRISIAEKVGNDGNFFGNHMNATKADFKRNNTGANLREEAGQQLNAADHNHHNVCRGQVKQSIELKSRLFCWYEHQVHPTWRIGPMKAELHSMFPQFEIVQYYDVLDKKTTESIKASVRSFWAPFTDSPDAPFNPRVRYAAAVDEKIYPQENLLTSLAERVSGLHSKKHVTKPILLSYPPGGHFRAHRDGVGFNDADDVFAHRIATCIFHLEEGTLGGETGFANGRVAVRGAKGSAVMWYNMMPSGELDLDTFHGSCPLILGEKYVALKWMIYDEQTHLTCPVDPNSRFEFPVNGKSKYSGAK